jgi:hypothetical protein
LKSKDLLGHFFDVILELFNIRINLDDGHYIFISI